MLIFILACHKKSLPLDKLKLTINYTVLKKDSLLEDLIVKRWEDYLNSGDSVYGFYSEKVFRFGKIPQTFLILHRFYL